MKLLKFVPSFKPLESILLVTFILLVVIDIPIPTVISNVVTQPLGLVTLLLLSLYLFYTVHPIIAVLFVFVVYDLVIKSDSKQQKITISEPTPSQQVKDVKMKKMNPSVKVTLEEEVVEKMSPIGHSDISVYTASTFKPISQDVGSASLV